MNHYGCDRCGIVTTKEEMDGRQGAMPNDWESVKLHHIGPGNWTRRFDFCRACVVQLRLEDRLDLTDSESVGDQLVRLLEDLAQGVIESQ